MASVKSLPMNGNAIAAMTQANPANPARIAVPSDEELLCLVGSSRDRAAFDEIFRRHQSAFFSLVLQITGSRESAEDALQEAGLDIWRFSPSFKPDGNARGWMYRIVAREGLKELARRQKKSRSMKELTAAQDEPGDALMTEHAVEKGEVQAALAKALQVLSPYSRNLIVLYYGAGLSHRQISEEMQIPERTVGFKLGEALGQLRMRLKSAGFAAAIPALAPGALRDALCSMHEAPPALHAKILSRLDAAASHRQAPAPRYASPGRLGWKAIPLAAAGLAAAAASFWYLASPDEGKGSLALEAAPPVPAASPPVLAAESPHEPFFRKWNFNDGPSGDFIPITNAWEWKRERDGVGRMLIKDKKEANILIDIEVPRRPFVIRFRAKPYAMGLTRDNFLWTDGFSIPRHRIWSVPYVMPVDSEITVHFVDRYIFYKANGKTTLLQAFDAPYPHSKLLAILMNFKIESLEIRELSPMEIEALAFDPDAEIRRLEREKANTADQAACTYRLPGPDPDGVPEQDGRLWRWTFERGVPKELTLFGQPAVAKAPQGGADGKGGEGAELVLSSAREQGLQLSTRVPNAPFRLEIATRAQTDSRRDVTVLDSTTCARVPCRTYAFATDEEIAACSTLRYFIWKNRLLAMGGSRIVAAAEFGQDVHYQTILIHGRNWSLRRLECFIEEKEGLPAAMRDEASFKKLLQSAARKQDLAPEVPSIVAEELARR